MYLLLHLLSPTVSVEPIHLLRGGIDCYIGSRLESPPVPLLCFGAVSALTPDADYRPRRAHQSASGKCLLLHLLPPAVSLGSINLLRSGVECYICPRPQSPSGPSSCMGRYRLLRLPAPAVSVGPPICFGGVPAVTLVLASSHPRAHQSASGPCPHRHLLAPTVAVASIGLLRLGI